MILVRDDKSNDDDDEKEEEEVVADKAEEQERERDSTSQFLDWTFRLILNQSLGVASDSYKSSYNQMIHRSCSLQFEVQ